MHEAEIHNGVIAWLKKQRLSYIHNRMDKKSGIASGFPDITVIHCGRAWVCELKTQTGKLSAKQKEVIAELQANGTPVTVARSVGEAIGCLEAWMGVERDSGPLENRNRHILSRLHQPHKNENTEPVEHAGTTHGGDLSQNLFIAMFGGNNCVFSGSPNPGGLAALVRLATTADLINLKRR